MKLFPKIKTALFRHQWRISEREGVEFGNGLDSGSTGDQNNAHYETIEPTLNQNVRQWETVDSCKLHSSLCFSPPGHKQTPDLVQKLLKIWDHFLRICIISRTSRSVVSYRLD